MTEERIKQAEKAFVLGFPLIFNLDQMKRFTDKGIGDLPAAPFNVFSHAVNKATPEGRFVSVNNDTLYSICQVDLSSGPMILEVPEVRERYYVLQLVDAWTENFSYIGKRSVAGRGGKYLLVPPDHQATIPDTTVEIIHCPTKLISIVGRWACEPEEIETVGKLQKKLKVTSLTNDSDQFCWQNFNDDHPMVFWEKFWHYLKDFPLSPTFESYHATLESLGLFNEKNPFIDIEEEDEKLFLTAEKRGRNLISDQLQHGKAVVENGWQINYHAFDYNTEFFELGTVNSPEWILPHKTNNELDQLILTRATASMGGLWGNHGYEAVYLPIYVDSNGDRLVGEKEYQLTFEHTPPTNAFWSLTMYTFPEYYLVANELDRYSIGDRTKGLVYQGDQLTIYLSTEKPNSAEQQKNWLPAPKGYYRPLLRIYLPKDAFFDENYVLPKIEPIN